jgi:tripartite-type tricarboxylate transporter receptor subunit TctC
MSSTGSVTQLAAELFTAMAGVNIVRINYKGAGPAVNALIGGEVQPMFVASSPEEFAATIKSEMTKWRKVIKDAGIHE